MFLLVFLFIFSPFFTTLFIFCQSQNQSLSIKNTFLLIGMGDLHYSHNLLCMAWTNQYIGRNELKVFINWPLIYNERIWICLSMVQANFFFPNFKFHILSCYYTKKLIFLFLKYIYLIFCTNQTLKITFKNIITKHL